MELAKWISFIVLWITAVAQDEFPINPDTQNYQYNYYVRDENTGDVKSHGERKIGDVVTGEYTVGEPTGDLRVVSYTADEGGFRANVKYEEGGSPLSDIRDKERQVSPPVSGYQFEWLPGNADIEGASGKTEPSEESQTTNEAEGSGSTSNSEATSEVTSTESTVPVSDGTTPGTETKSSSSDETSSTGSMGTVIPGTQVGSEPKVDESYMGDVPNVPKGKEDSQEAAASAPESQEVAPTEPNHVYLPSNIPFYNAPPVPDPQDAPPTIIYASQNFYNPWQWFGTTARVQREPPPSQPPSTNYMTDLGYIIVPGDSKK